MKKYLLDVAILALLLGATVTVFALNHGNDLEGSELELEFEACPLDPEPESETTDC